MINEYAKTPLTTKQIFDLYDKTSEEMIEKWRIGEGSIFKIEFVRAIEKHYGIGIQND